jgi:parvulin-like peptidyl-prolyl isomerase
MKTSKKIPICILLIFAIFFAVFAGCTDQNQDNSTLDNSDISENIAATVNGEEITTEEVNLLVQQQQGVISESYALERLIEQKILIQQARKEGYMPTNEEAENQLIIQISEQNQTLDEYKQYIERQGDSYDEKLESYKDQIALQKYLEDAVNQEKYDITDKEAEQDLQNLLMEQNKTLDEYKEYLAEQGYSYEEQLQNYKIGLKRQALIEDLKVDAVIKYY